MDATVLENATTQRIEVISAQARQVHVGPVLLAFVAAVLIGAGRCAGGLINGMVWACLAIREGYRDARAPRQRDGGAG